MKMKKFIVLFLALAMCLSLCACGKSKAVANVEELIEAIGEVTIDSESAIAAAEEAYSALPEKEKDKVNNYAVLTAARENLDILFADRYCGDWFELQSGLVFSFHEDGSFKYEAGFEKYSGTYEFIDNGVRVDFELDFDLFYEVKNDVEYLTNEDLNLELVKAEYATTTEYDINIDNWQDFFTLEEKTEIHRNGFGDVEGVSLWCVLNLKDEFVDRLCFPYGNEIVVSVETTYTSTSKAYEVNGDEIVITGDGPWWSDDQEGIEVRDLRQDYFLRYYFSPDDADISYYYISIGERNGYGYENETYIDIWEDFEISRIKGTLILYDLPLQNR